MILMLSTHSYSARSLFIFTGWPHINSQRKQNSSLDFLTTVPPPNANLLAALSSFSPSFWCQRKIPVMSLLCKASTFIYVLKARDSHLSGFCIISFLLSYKVNHFPLCSHLAQWFSMGNNFASLAWVFGNVWRHFRLSQWGTTGTQLRCYWHPVHRGHRCH